MAADPTVTSHVPAPGAEYAETASAAYRSALEVIESVEPRIAAATRKELADQRDSLKLIASENYASPAVLLTMGTWFSDKYAEGTIGHRFYAACQNVDTVEALAEKTDVKAQAKAKVEEVKSQAKAKVEEVKAKAAQAAPESPQEGVEQAQTLVKQNPKPAAIAGVAVALFVLWRLLRR